jgi:NADH dehydrogenase
MTTKILVLGGGFAGLAAASELSGHLRRGADISVRLLDRRIYSTFAPMLPDLISGRVRPEHIRYDIGSHCRRLGIAFSRTTVQAIDPSEGRVETDSGLLTADYLIIGLGCETNYFGRSDLKPRTHGLKSIDEGLHIRAEVSRLLEREARAHAIVVGGGYTGFEVASHLAYLLQSLTGISYAKLSDRFRVLLVEKSESILRNCSPGTRREALKIACEYGMEVKTGVTVDAFEAEDAVRLTDGTVLQNALVVWTAGVKPGRACEGLSVERTQGGRLAVDEYLRLPGCVNAFAAGDAAGPVPEGSHEPLRMAVQFSILGGSHAARNVMRTIQGKPLLPFRPYDPGYLVPLAPCRASGVVLGHEISGCLPYLFHYLMCAYRSWGWQNRLGVVTDFLREKLGFA